MAENLLRHGQIGAHEKGRPVNGVKADDILADQVQVGRPEFVPHLTAVRVTKASDVIGERIHPHIHHVIVVAGDLHAPVETGSADGQVFQAAFDEGKHFVSAAYRFQKARLVEQFDKLIGIFRQAEEPRLFLGPFDRRTLRRELLSALPFDQFLFIVIGFVADRIPAFIPVKIQIALGFHSLPDGPACLVMILVGRPDEPIVSDIQPVEEILERTRHLVGKFPRSLAKVTCLLSHLEPVFVGPCLEAHFTAHQPLETRDDIGSNRFIGVADMRLAIGIVDCGGYVIRVSHCRVR